MEKQLMYQFPIVYDEPLFRPPSEARSLIIQATLGCSWNKCAFCEMYTSKQFKARKEEEVFEDIEAFIPYASEISRVFIADGDPLVLSTPRLFRILEKLYQTFSNLQRVSTYASPTNINKKSEEDLKALRNAGLTLLYVGIESGDDEVLNCLQKGETFTSIVKGINKAQAADMDCSVMIINGAGGQNRSERHAIGSAKVLNATQPKYASTLVLTAHKGMDHFKDRYIGEYKEMNIDRLFAEMHLFIKNLQLKETIFRSDHASNSLVLKGVLGRDKDKFLQQINQALSSPELANLRQTGYGGY